MLKQSTLKIRNGLKDAISEERLWKLQILDNLCKDLGIPTHLLPTTKIIDNETFNLVNNYIEKLVEASKQMPERQAIADLVDSD